MIDQKCTCQVCKIARMSLDYQKYAAPHSTSVGAPKTTPIPSPAKVLTVWSKCFTPIGQGKPHQCNTAQKRNNLSTIVRNVSKKSRANVASNTLKTIAEDQCVSTRGGIVQLQTGSKPIPVQIGTTKVQPKKATFSHENMLRLQTANNLSDRSLL